VKKAYWIDGRLLTERELQDIRSQLEGLKRVTAISDEMRDVIETEWPELAARRSCLLLGYLVALDARRPRRAQSDSNF
jgi:hypothetical protein